MIRTTTTLFAVCFSVVALSFVAVEQEATAIAPAATPDVPPADTTEARSISTSLYLDAAFDARALPAVPVSLIDDETLWLARAVYSETKRPEEQWLVAWVIRNRVETSYRGRQTYHEVVLDPYQFSAFNEGNPKRTKYGSLMPTSTVPGWERVLRIAHHARHLDAEHRPFPRATRHFYSERSLPAGAPVWAEGHAPVDLPPTFDVEAERFRFFADVI
ncbi:MAG: cell wall hydrolase [Bacteroidota bacterium]